MPGELLATPSRRVAAQPGQRHLVAVHGFQLGPHGGRQRAGQGSGGGVLASRSSRLEDAHDGDARGARARAGQRGDAGTRQRGRARQGPVPRRPRRGRTPGAAGRSRRRPAAGPCRRRPRQRRRAAARRWPPVPSPARRRSQAGERRSEQRHDGEAEGEADAAERPRSRGAGGESGALWPGTRRARAWLVSKLTVPWPRPALSVARGGAVPSSLAGGPQPHGVSQRGGPRLFGKRRFGRLRRLRRTSGPCPG